MTPANLVLHDYWRSTASYRVRIALNLKGLTYDRVTHDLRKGEQRRPEYLALAPSGLVPALVVDGISLTQSPAILEWLEERYPEPCLLPEALEDRAIIRAMTAIIACDIHPLNNLRVLGALKNLASAEQATVDAWISRWIVEGFQALEVLIGRHGAGFAFGNRPSLADCFLVPQLYSARRFNVDLTAFSHLVAAAAAAEALTPFADAHPAKQPDADA